jgi:hypothetical protein
MTDSTRVGIRHSAVIFQGTDIGRAQVAFAVTHVVNAVTGNANLPP